MGSRRMRLYALLAALRVVGSVLLLGMVHPDEFFQSQEVMATHFVPKESAIWRELFVPWEFQLPMPNRSILFPALVAGIPYKIFEVVGVELTGWLMLVTPRLLLCLLSFIIDVVLYTVVGKLSRDQKVEIKKEKQEKVLLLFASSWPTLVFLCRPFSNTFETLVLALCFAVLFLVSPKLGSSAPSGLRRLARVVVVAVQGLVAFLMWTLVFVVVDTLYFHPEVFAGDLNSSVVEKIAQNAVFAPLNNLMYNVQYDNLELHGVHPRFTHLTVNMPMLFGPVFLVFLEPRFMLPALVPLHLFTALSGRAGVVRFLTTHKLGVLLWIVFNLALTLFFAPHWASLEQHH
uniref:Mannosyltransferase n=1 Tax=Phytophthora ramorum TaxID=164328 RepID=H3HBL0_PHYRM